jgi:hypothetical protein
MDRKRRANLCGSLILLIICLWGFFLWGHVKAQVHSQRVNMLDELETWLTSAIADVTKDIWQEMDCRWDVCRATDGAHSEV